MDTSIIHGGKVTNIIVASLETARALYPDADEVRARLPGDVVEAGPAPRVEPPPVTAYQLRAALNQKGLRAAVEAAVAAAPQSVKDEWEFKTSYRRDHPTVSLIAAAIGKTPKDIDEVFALAATIE
jgi:hypothetical protein